MKKLIFILVMLIIITGCSSEGITSENIEEAQNFIDAQDEFIYAPTKKADGEKYTIGVVDIDPYYPSGEMLYYVVKELINTGWIEDIPIPFDSMQTDVKELVNYLSQRDLGEYIEFSSEDNYYVAIDGEEYCSQSLNALLENKELDLVIAIGTISGDFAKRTIDGRIPLMIYFSIDPVDAGLINDDNYSTEENTWVHISNEAYEKQLIYYHNVFDFNNIGMIYYDESVAALNMYEKAAEENNFNVTTKKIDRIDTSSQENKDTYYNNLKNTLNELINNDNIDAFMINADIIVDQNVVEDVCNLCYEKNIPVFAQTGEEFVENGALMTVVTMDARQQAPFFVNTMAAY